MSPEEVLMTTIAPLQRSVANYSEAPLAFALRDRQRQEQLQDQAIKHQQALQMLGLEHQHAMNLQHAKEEAVTAREREQNQAMGERSIGLLDERQLLSDTEDVEKRNRERDSLYETASRYGFKLDPNATAEENQNKAHRMLEDKAVEGYKSLVGERGKIKDEIDDLLTPKKISDTEIVKALAVDPVASGLLDKSKLTELTSGRKSLQDVASQLSNSKREALLSQAEVIRGKLETKVNEEQQRKASARIRELSNRHDELSTAISSAQKAIPAHRLGEIYSGGGSKTTGTAADKKAAFLSDVKALRGSSFDTPLSPSEEQQFQQWKAKYAPNDSGADYDLRGAFKSGLTPGPDGHWPDTFKKPNHPTFSNESIYARGPYGKLAGHWDGGNFIPPTSSTPETPPESILGLPPGVLDATKGAARWMAEKVIAATLGGPSNQVPVPAPPRPSMHPNPMMIINPFSVQGQMPPGMPINPRLPTLPPELMPTGE